MKLKRAFKWAAGIVATPVVLYTAWVLAFYAGRGERLTTGEAQSLTAIFGDEINTNKIRKHMRPENHITGWPAMRPAGLVIPFLSHIDFFEKHSKDYSRDSSSAYGLFMHESMHALQSQLEPCKYDFNPRYSYELTWQSRFNAFDQEQQAEIITDYARRFLHPEKKYAYDPKNMPKDFDAMLIKVVEDRFPSARKSRLKETIISFNAASPRL